MAKAIITIEVPDGDTCYNCDYTFSTASIDDDTDRLVMYHECQMHREEIPHFKKCDKCKKSIVKEEDSD